MTINFKKEQEKKKLKTRTNPFKKLTENEKEMAFSQLDAASEATNGKTISSKGIQKIIDSATDKQQLQSTLRKIMKNSPITASKFSKKSGAGTKTQKPNMAKGGRAILRGGGICKKGMNKKAVGKNS